MCPAAVDALGTFHPAREAWDHPEVPRAWLVVRTSDAGNDAAALATLDVGSAALGSMKASHSHYSPIGDGNSIK